MRLIGVFGVFVVLALAGCGAQVSNAPSAPDETFWLQVRAQDARTACLQAADALNEARQSGVGAGRARVVFEAAC